MWDISCSGKINLIGEETLNCEEQLTVIEMTTTWNQALDLNGGPRKSIFSNYPSNDGTQHISH